MNRVTTSVRDRGPPLLFVSFAGSGARGGFAGRMSRGLGAVAMDTLDWATLGLLQQRKKLTNKSLEMQARATEARVDRISEGDETPRSGLVEAAGVSEIRNSRTRPRSGLVAAGRLSTARR